MKVNKILNTNSSINFKNSPDNKKINIDDYKKETISGLIGLGCGIAALAVKNKNAKPLSIGISAYFLSYFVQLGIESAKEIEKLNALNTKYKPKNNNQNQFDKFVSSVTPVLKNDLGDDQKNQQFYDENKNNEYRKSKINIISIGIGCLSAITTFAIGAIKKQTDKLFKAEGAFILGTAVSMILGHSINALNSTKNNDKES